MEGQTLISDKDSNAPASSAKRTRRYRKNRRLGLRPYTIRLSQGELEALVAKGYLNESDRTDLEMISTAAEAFMLDRLAP